MRFVYAAILFAVAAYFHVRGILIFCRMKDEVNSVLPEESQLPQIGVNLRQGGVIPLHKSFFPGSALRRSYVISWVGNVVSFFSALGCVIRVHTGR